MSARVPVPRGRHAPPPDVRRSIQRARLFDAAADVFARVGYADASAEAIARAAGMSKATFYEHFANKEECILALFDEAAGAVLQAMAEAANEAGPDPRKRLRAGLRAFLEKVASNPAWAQTLLVEIVAAGERGVERRERIISAFAAAVEAENAAAARRRGAVGRLTSLDDAVAIVGAIAELTSRRVRLGQPESVIELEPVIERLMIGLMSAGRPA
jgi:AcrR family transcriptional regulator